MSADTESYAEYPISAVSIAFRRFVAAVVCDLGRPKGSFPGNPDKHSDIALLVSHSRWYDRR